MLEELKKIKITEIDTKITSLTETKPETRTFSWLEKKVTKKREYEEYTDYLIAFETKKQKELEELEKLRTSYQRAQTTYALGLSLTEAMELLKSRGITPVLTKNDFCGNQGYRVADIDRIEGLILVHKCGHLPKDGKIRTLKDAKVYYDKEKMLGDRKVNLKMTRLRDTIHFSVNGEVASHLEGNWDGKRYAILIPMKDIPKSQISNAAPEDTYTNGSVYLTPNTWILVPKGEGKKVKEENPQANVIEYEGESVSGFADTLVTFLGYKLETITNNDWANYEDSKRYSKLMRELGYSTHPHAMSRECFNEEVETCILEVTQYLELVIAEPTLLDDDNFVRLLKEKIIERFMSMRIDAQFNTSYTAGKIIMWLKGYHYDINVDKIQKQCTDGKRITLYDCLAIELINALKKNITNDKGKIKSNG